MSNETESRHVVDLLASEIGNRKMCLWDVGANVGGVALPLLHRCPDLTAVLFEPSPEVGGRLLRNLQLNPKLVTRAMFVAAALSSTTGWTEFFPSGHKENSGIGGLANASNRTSVGVRVACCRADELPADIPAPDILKIDVEGFELEVLRGMGPLLDKCPPILFEHQPTLYRPRGHSLDALVQHLQKLGYSLRSTRYAKIDLEREDDLYATNVQHVSE